MQHYRASVTWQEQPPQEAGANPIRPAYAPHTPPPMPGAGWYPDPGQPTAWRYWDGAQWTQHVAPMQFRSPRDPYSFGAWFEATTALVKATLRRVGVLVAGVQVAAYALVGVLTAAVFSGPTGDRWGELIDHLEQVFDDGDDITDAEWDRAGELFGDVAGSLILLGIVAVVVLGVVSLWTVALTARASWDESSDTSSAGHRSVVQPRSLFAGAMARLPAVFASALIVGIIGTAALLVPVMPFLLSLAVGAGSATLGITATLGAIAAVVAVCWVSGRLSLSLVLAARGGDGLGIRRSWALTDGHYWQVVGRLLIAGLLASVITAPFGFLNGVPFVFGMWFGIAVLTFLQALSSAASVLLVTPAQVMTARHLEAQETVDPVGPIVAG